VQEANAGTPEQLTWADAAEAESSAPAQTATTMI
jgi:hypothetical protein